ncbi:MAG: ArsC family reductase [Alphaproteobacteria bacterium]|nr:ArsC family reductase [Alphaproteobacteria bacterium]
MNKIKIYGIKNCDTMKKAFRWMEDEGIDYDFHDYKKAGIDRSVLENSIDQHGWDVVINKRGTTWRQLPENMQNSMDQSKAIQVAEENPSIVKRPIFVSDGKTWIGFSEDIKAKLKS